MKVRRVFCGVNPRKTAGLNGIPVRVLRGCVDQQTEVFTSIFNLALSTCTDPKCFKSATIVPIPKKPSVSSLNDYRLDALTSTVMKHFERLVLKHIKSSLPLILYQHQFTYRANRSTGDAINTDLHTVLTHLEQPGSYAANHHTCRWIKDFLTDWPMSHHLLYTSSAIHLTYP